MLDQKNHHIKKVTLPRLEVEKKGLISLTGKQKKILKPQILCNSDRSCVGIANAQVPPFQFNPSTACKVQVSAQPKQS